MRKVMKVSRSHWLFLIIVAGVLVCAGASIQKPKLPMQRTETKLEAFEKQTGTVIIRGRTEIGWVSDTSDTRIVVVSCTEIIDVSTSRRRMGIILGVGEIGNYDRSDSLFIDYDEIESLLNGIDYIAKVTPSSTKLSIFEAVYKTKGELSFVTYSNRSGKIEAAVSTGYTGSTRAFITMAKLSELRSIIAKAKEKLDEIK